jgi:hypothetical protein
MFQLFEGKTVELAEGGITVSDEFEVVVIKLFVPNDLINGSVEYIFGKEAS